ncbi:MAG: hypothetical protein LAO08_20365 [Acidobacteriia bacterium]|nr:hypothetical protein [Terriglobia bacterium]
MKVLSREPIVFGPISSLDVSSSKGGYRTFDEALGRSRTELVSAGEISGLLGRSGAGFQIKRK